LVIVTPDTRADVMRAVQGLSALVWRRFAGGSDHPKRCGHYEGKEVVSCEEMCKKLEAAVEVRTDPIW
jgi:hypothetical protein